MYLGFQNMNVWEGKHIRGIKTEFSRQWASCFFIILFLLRGPQIFTLQLLKHHLLLEIVSAVLTHFSHVSDPMDCSPAGSSMHGILQARILAMTAVSFSRGSSQLRAELMSLASAALAGRSFATAPAGQGSWKPRLGY